MRKITQNPFQYNEQKVTTIFRNLLILVQFHGVTSPNCIKRLNSTKEALIISEK